MVGHRLQSSRLTVISFFATFLTRALISDYPSQVQSPDGAARIYFPNSQSAACFEPTSVELLQTGALEGCSTE